MPSRPDFCLQCPRSLFLALFVMIWPSLSFAAEPAEAEGDAGPTAIVVVDVRPSGPVSEDQVAGLSALLTSEVASYPELQVISSSDVREMLGFEAQRQLLGCDDDSACLAEIGGALGAPYLLSSEVSRFGDNWLFTLVLLDLASSTPIARRTIRSASENEVLDQLGPTVRHVLGSLLDDETSVTAPPGRRPAAAKSGAIGGVLTWASIGTGAAVLAGGSVLVGLSLRHYSRMSSSTEPLYTRDDVSRFEKRGNIGVGLMVGGAVLTGIGVGMWRTVAPGSAESPEGIELTKIGIDPPDAESTRRALVQVTPLVLGDGAGLMLEVTRW